MQFENLVNFRDLGGIVNRDGRKIKLKRLLRSGELFGISERDIETLKEEYQVSAVVDFRRHEERWIKPDPQIEGADDVHANLVVEDKEKYQGVAPKDHFDFRIDFDVDEVMIKDYRKLITSETAQTGFRLFMETLLENQDRSVLWHCFAGKDRTGIAAMHILTALDVDYETIKAEYLLTNAMREKDNQRYFDQAREQGANDEQIEGIRKLLTVNPDYLDAAYETIHEVYGSYQNYLSQFLGIDEEKQGQLKHMYLE